MIPVALAPNLITHFRPGGDRIARLRGIEQTSEFQPEEWLGATVSRSGHDDVGLAHALSGALLRDLVVEDPAGWIGPRHADAAIAGDTGILVNTRDVTRNRIPHRRRPGRLAGR